MREIRNVPWVFIRGKIIYIWWGSCGKKSSRKDSWEERHLSLLCSIGVGFWQVKMCGGKKTARAGAQMSIWNEWLEGGLSYFLTSEIRKYLSQIAVRGSLSENSKGGELSMEESGPLGPCFWDSISLLLLLVWSLRRMFAELYCNLIMRNAKEE